MHKSRLASVTWGGNTSKFKYTIRRDHVSSIIIEKTNTLYFYIICITIGRPFPLSFPPQEMFENTFLYYAWIGSVIHARD